MARGILHEKRKTKTNSLLEYLLHDFRFVYERDSPKHNRSLGDVRTFVYEQAPKMQHALISDPRRENNT